MPHVEVNTVTILRDLQTAARERRVALKLTPAEVYLSNSDDHFRHAPTAGMKTVRNRRLHIDSMPFVANI